jgi:putative addiction module antidote
MAATVRLRRVGNSLGFILPKEATDRLNVADGDTLHLVADQYGLHLTPYDPDFDAAMDAFAETRRHYRNTLRRLAK